MPETTSHKLNLFQKAVLNWNRSMPYNAAHVVKVGGDLDTGRLEESLRACLGRYGLYGFHLDEAASRFGFRSGETPLSLEVLAAGDRFLERLQERLETDLNEPFTLEQPGLPLRFFAAPAGSGFYLGLVYFHVIADASSITYLLDDVVRCYETGAVPSVAAAKLYPRARLGALSILRGLPGWLGSIGRDAADIRRTARIGHRAGVPKRTGLELARLAVEPSVLARRCRSLGVTVNDALLAALLKASSGLRPQKTGPRRTKLSVGSIASTRRDLNFNGGREFGVYLSSFRVSAEAPERQELTELARDVARQTRRVKHGRLYWRTAIETAFGRRLERFYAGAKRDRFYAKHYPLAAGLTNIDLAPLWSSSAALPDYWRAVSTNAAVPLVFSVTSSSDALNIGASFSSHVYTREQAAGTLRDFVARLEAFSRS